MQYLLLTFQECMQTLPQKMSRNKIKAYTHTAFLIIFRVVHETKDKNALEICSQHFKRSPKCSILPTIYEILDQMTCLKINLVRWLTSKTKKNLSKTFLKNNQNIKFQLYYLKVSANVKIAIR